MSVTTFTQQPLGTSGTITLMNLPGANAAQRAKTSGLVLSPAAEPFPRKLVEKVNSGQFVEMSSWPTILPYSISWRPSMVTLTFTWEELPDRDSMMWPH